MLGENRSNRDEFMQKCFKPFTEEHKSVGFDLFCRWGDVLRWEMLLIR
jgi:hypothetical protein